MKTQRTNETRCPLCKHQHTALTGNGDPRPGDLTICAECGGVLIFRQVRQAGGQVAIELFHDPDWREGLDDDFCKYVEETSAKTAAIAAMQRGELKEDILVFSGGAPCACGPGFCCSEDANGGYGVCIGRRKSLPTFPPCPHCGAEHQGISAKNHPKFPGGPGRVVCWNCAEHPEPPYRLGQVKAEAQKIVDAMDAWARGTQGEES